MFGRKKLIEENLELKDKIEILERDIKFSKDRIEMLESDIKHYKEKEDDMLNGKHFPDATCKGCKYLVEEKGEYYTNYYCALNSKCKDKVLVE